MVVVGLRRAAGECSGFEAPGEPSRAPAPAPGRAGTLLARARKVTGNAGAACRRGPHPRLAQGRQAEKLPHGFVCVAAALVSRGSGVAGELWSFQVCSLFFVQLRGAEPGQKRGQRLLESR